MSTKLASRILPLMLLAACVNAEDFPEGQVLQNSDGKEDAAFTRSVLTDASPRERLWTKCEDAGGCSGYVMLDVQVPDNGDACAHFFADERCGTATMPESSLTLGTLSLRSRVEGQRSIPFVVHTEDGAYTRTSLAVAYTAEQNEWVAFDFTKTLEGREVQLSVHAEWGAGALPEAQELESFLAGVPGLRFREIGTQYPGYRSYMLYFEQPLNHVDVPEGETFLQRAVLHHKSRALPMVLYTSGYELTEDYNSEITESLGFNQLSTEQRFFDESAPIEVEPGDWQHVTIRQAAADHHRFVEMLKPFYSGAWIGTGHSKGGMTSIYHRRFYPEDLDATVAYVAPISFRREDPRYIPHLDQIGTEECRNRMRTYQNAILTRGRDIARHWLTTKGQVENPDDATLDEFVSSYVDQSVLWMEWGFWQSQGIRACDTIPTGASLEDVAFLTDQLFPNADAPASETFSGIAYSYQANAELGYQAVATAHLVRPIQMNPFENPTDVNPTFFPFSMQDVQRWVLEESEQMLFIYGEYDPWTGGAFALPTNNPEVVRVTVPQGAHSAVLRDLPAATRDQLMNTLERWIMPAGNTLPTPRWQPQFAPYPPRLNVTH